MVSTNLASRLGPEAGKQPHKITLKCAVFHLRSGPTSFKMFHFGLATLLNISPKVLRVFWDYVFFFLANLRRAFVLRLVSNLFYLEPFFAQHIPYC